MPPLCTGPPAVRELASLYPLLGIQEAFIKVGVNTFLLASWHSSRVIGHLCGVNFPPFLLGGLVMRKGLSVLWRNMLCSSA